jgi:ketosteroid isomerase-like protein
VRGGRRPRRAREVRALRRRRAEAAAPRDLLDGRVGPLQQRLLAFAAALPPDPLPLRATYAATKGFVVTFTRTLAAELAGAPVRVQVLCPGYTRTEFHMTHGGDPVDGTAPHDQPAAAMDPDDVVLASLVALGTGEVVCVPGLADRPRSRASSRPRAGCAAVASRRWPTATAVDTARPRGGAWATSPLARGRAHSTEGGLSAQDVQVLRDAYGAFARGDVPAVMAAFHEDITWEVPDTLPFGGTFQGHEGVGRFFGSLAETFDEISVEPQEYIDGGDVVVVIARDRVSAGGGTAETRAAHVWRMRDGKAAAFLELADTAPAMRVLGAGTPAAQVPSAS